MDDDSPPMIDHDVDDVIPDDDQLYLQLDDELGEEAAAQAAADARVFAQMESDGHAQSPPNA